MDPLDPRIGVFNRPLQPGDPKKSQKKDETGKTKSFGRVLGQEKEKIDQDLRLQNAGQATEAEIEGLLDEVHEAGNELARLPSPENIQDYKRKIARFLQVIVAESFTTSEKTAWRKRDNVKVKHVLVQRINEKLDRLAAYVLQNQKDKLEILRRTDELHGLLVDLKS